MEISPAALLEQITSGTAPTILDVRSRWEYKGGHVPGAIHLPFWTLEARVSEVPASHGDPIVVYCGYGPRAWMAGAVLRRHGFRSVKYLDGHMHGWRQAGLPEETSHGRT
jgi:rhodanese-related sulfurtransferase